MRRSLSELIMALGLGLLLACLWTWPLLPNLGSALPFDPASAGPAGSDMHIWTWNFWWAGEVAAGRGLPFHSDAIFLPLGHSLVFHTHSFFWGLVTLPLQWLFGVTFAVGAALLLLPATAFAAAWALARDLGSSRPAAFLCGFAWAFAPYFAQKGLEHLAFTATPWPPLLVLFLLRWMRSRESGAWRPALGAGLVVGLGLLSGSLTGLYLVVLGALVALLAPGGPAPARPVLRLRLLEPRALTLFLVTAWVVAWPLLAELRVEAELMARAAAQVGDAGAQLGRDVIVRPELGDFLRLSARHPLGGVPADAPPGWNEVSALHVSAALVVLAALALGRGRALRGWLVLALVGLLLAWDPVIAAADGGVFSSLYQRLPLLEALRVPARFLPLALLPLAVLGAFGLDRLLKRSLPAAGLVALVLVVESWSRPVPLMDVTPPPAVSALADATPRAGSPGVLSLPIQPGASKAMTWQAQHGRPVVFSYVARANPRVANYWARTAPDLFSLAVPRLRPDGSVDRPDPLALAIDLAHVGVGEVLVDEARLAAGAPGLLDMLQELLDEMPGWERQDVAGPVAWWRRIA